jgi:hypothetical protein
MTIEDARKHNRYFLVNSAELEGFEEHVKWLESLLYESCSIVENANGEKSINIDRQLVERVRGLKIEIYPNEHPPPHFHVKSKNINASFRIENCAQLKGQISPKDYEKVKYWHESSKKLLIEIWNSTRPTDCIVGPYTGT